MEAELSKAMLMRLYEAARNKDPDAVADLLAAGFVEHGPQVAHEPREGENSGSGPWEKL